MSEQTFAPVDVVTPQGLLQQVALTVKDGMITQIAPLAQACRAPRDLIIPPFIDLHIHGAGGYGPEQGTAESLLQMSAVLSRQGVSAFCPTLYCAKPDFMAQQLRSLVPAVGHEMGAQILGFHLEGPFLSPDKPGVMKPQDIAPANLEDFKQIYEAAQGHISIMTLAPELPGIDPIISFCIKHNVCVQAGHTNATYEQMQAAFDKGVHGITHWGNAMSGLHQRAPGVMGAALLNSQISCEIIADGKHVHPALLTLLKQVKPISQITAVTDALLPTGQTTGPFYANREEVCLQEGVWKRKTDGITAGSSLTMPAAFKQLVESGYTPAEAVLCTSTNAAHDIKTAPPQLVEGAPANFVVLEPGLRLKSVFYQGNLL